MSVPLLMFRPFRAADLAQCGDAFSGSFAIDARAVEGPFAWSAMDAASGRVIGAAGCVVVRMGYAYAWAAVNHVPRRAWPAVTRRMQRMLHLVHRAGHWRIEADARADYPPAIVLLRHLGFQVEGRREAFGPDASDHILFARIDAAVLAQRHAFLASRPVMERQLGTKQGEAA